MNEKDEIRAAAECLRYTWRRSPLMDQQSFLHNQQSKQELQQELVDVSQQLILATAQASLVPLLTTQLYACQAKIALAQIIPASSNWSGQGQQQPSQQNFAGQKQQSQQREYANS